MKSEKEKKRTGRFHRADFIRNEAFVSPFQGRFTPLLSGSFLKVSLIKFLYRLDLKIPVFLRHVFCFFLHEFSNKIGIIRIFRSDSLYRSCLKFQTFIEKLSNAVPGFFVLLGFLTVSGCTIQTPLSAPSTIRQFSQAKEERDSAKKERSSSRRQGRSRNRADNRNCGDRDSCKDICRDIFDHRIGRDECEEYSVSEVEDFETIFHYFRAPNSGTYTTRETEKTIKSATTGAYLDNLNRIETDILEDFVGTVQDLPDYIGNHIAQDTVFGKWIGEQSEITEIFQVRDDNSFSVFKAIFGLTLNNTEIQGAVKEAVNSGNTEFLDWVDDYLRSRAGCDTDEKLFTCYCNMVDSSDDSTERDYSAFSPFNDLLGRLNKDMDSWRSDSDCPS